LKSCQTCVPKINHFYANFVIIVVFWLFWSYFGSNIDGCQSEGLMKKRGSAEIAGLLRQDIQRGKLRSQERLPAERELAETYSVARGTIREALNQLERDGLVEIRRGSGTYVLANGTDATNPAVENATPLELIDARFALEPHICRLAVLHARRQDLEKAEELLAGMEACRNEPARFSILDTAFHTLLAETTGNRLLIWIVAQINSVRNQDQWARMRQLTLNETTVAEYNSHHREIFDAIKRREPEQAAVIMKQHLEAARLSLTRAAST
jgi:GntR family uxuAB operon transcriptional repressor